jgi:hypothetical protein
MRPIFLNMKTSQGIETVDEFTKEPSQTPKDFRLYVKSMITEYCIAGMCVYKSSRSTNEWRQKSNT